MCSVEGFGGQVGMAECELKNTKGPGLPCRMLDVVLCTKRVAGSGLGQGTCPGYRLPPW